MLHNAYNNMHIALKNPNGFETSLSGSTVVSLLFDRNVVYCANAGDSRSVCYSFDEF